MLPGESAPSGREKRAPAVRRRVAAALALAAATVTIAMAIVSLLEDPFAGIVVLVGLFAAVQLAWQGAVQSGRNRVLLLGGAAIVLLVVLGVLAAQDLVGNLIAVGVGVVATSFAVRTAFGQEGSAGGRWREVPPSSAPVVLINPRSGDGRAERVGLADAARARGIEAVILEPGMDLPELARDAVARGADAIGMAGGDGSMAIVASIAAEHDVPFVCVPAGTRNHFALDLGVQRDDVVGALDAFVEGVETTVDLGQVNGRPFVNNVSLGVYAEAVSDPGYREAKLRTLRRTARDLLGPSGDVPRMQVVDDLGREHTSVAMMLVSNNPYALKRALGRSTRPAMDRGTLGVVLLTGKGGDRVWEEPSVTVTAPGPAPTAIDGEAVTLDSPLSFTTLPARLRVRISRHHPGLSPSGLLPPTLASTVPRLARLAAGRPPDPGQALASAGSSR
jgi:diacylglycerol kinase family enzyme